MKRTPLARRTPMSRGKAGTTARSSLRSRPTRETPIERVPPVLDLAAAAAALQHAQKAAETPRAFGGPVADPVKAARPADDGAFKPYTRTLILMRDAYTCQRCGCAPGDAWPGINLQHRSARQMGGTNRPHISMPSNGIVLCGSGSHGCHGWVEDHPALAEELGLVVASWADPATVPVYTINGWRRLVGDHSQPCPRPPMGESHMVAERITP